MHRKNFEGNKDSKRKAAQERQEVRNKRTPQEQLEILDMRLGKGIGAAKERAKLQKLIEKEA